MAGAKKGNFRELISPFLANKLLEIEEAYGNNSNEYHGLAKQYLKSPSEDIILPDDRRRHYESEVNIEFDGKPVLGVERLYKKTVLLEPTTVCAAHCRWCLRGQYPVKTLTKDNLEHSVRYIGSDLLNKDVDEVLITGGDPLMSPTMLDESLSLIKKEAPNIKIIRIGSRVPFQDPIRINSNLLNVFETYNFRYELGVNVNHPVEFWRESIEALDRLKEIGFKIYNQNPLLKGVNDNFETLRDLYTLLRENEIEAHYLFHAIPMRGMQHHRTSLEKGAKLSNQISSCGEFSGRAKPRYTVLSDIGKIVIYHDTIVDKDEKTNSLLLRSGFDYNQRKEWNPSWEKPTSTVIGNDGMMLTWYKDGNDN
ncbi:MAG: hypothetical protein CMM49_05935 [Rhodospirillaceae bacterium]|nr:hypothetical protein [Rhodospirillaceae bacterium]|tara:strand:+ start:2443 stop:3540 length:1098 start_codon:yes stop_codon:yes gene_type:complete